MTDPHRRPSGLPRARRRDRQRAAVMLSLAGVAAAGVLTFFVVRFAAERPDDVNLGQKVLRFDARRLAARIAEEGEPLLFKDPLTRRPGREVYVQHLGGSPTKGWVAIEAYAPGAPRRLECILDWVPAEAHFVDPCGDGTFAADGAGLRTYPAEVEGGDVVVDLRAAPTTAGDA